MRGKVSAVRMLLAASLCACTLAGCVGGRKNQATKEVNKEIEATLKEVHAFTGEVVRRVESAADPSAGVDDAQKYFEEKRPEIKSKIDSLRKINDADLSEETRGKKMESLMDDLMSVNSLQIKFMTNAMNGAVFKSKLEKLLNDYRALVDV
ncbi:MAG TPA: hypothetical protein VM866_05545 [Pyrinomonadaceae bacterium]|nr:hypothetical protein [Pyrinomonadaceae bacterium]